MALTISIEGKGVIANSDAVTNDTGGTATGDWIELGGGSISLSTETYLRGTNCVAGAYSNKAGWHYFDIGAGNELDFDTGGTELGQFFYFPIFNPTPGLNETETNGGLRIRLGSSTTDYREYMILAGDDFNGWNGSWKTFVLDPTKSGSVTDTGTFDVGAIRQIGIYVDATALAKGDNIFIDQISVGTGIRITGTSTTGWQDLVDYCTDYPNRAWPMIEERGGVIYVKGKVYIGGAVDGDGSANNQITTFSDSGHIIQFEDSQYWSGSAWVTTIPTDAYGIVIEDTASYRTEFTDGVLVGSDNGRSGSSIIGNDDQNVSLDLYGGNNASSFTKLYGTSIKNCTGTINSGNDSDHKFYGVSFIASSQFDPVGACEIRNCVFAETIAVTGDHSAALLWNANADVEDCSFIANSDAHATYKSHGIEFPAAISDALTNLTFSGNEVGIWFSPSTGNLTLTKGGTTNLGTSDYTNDSSGTVSITESVTLTVTVEDEDQNALQYAHVYANKQTAIQAYTADTGNTAGNGALIVNEVVDTAIPQTGWCFLWIKSLNKLQGYRFSSWTSKTFTFPTTVTFDCTGGGTATALQDSVNDFTALNIKVGDTVRNTTDGSWAVVDEITDASNIVTSPLSGGTLDVWTSGDTYSFHDLATTLTDNDDLVDIPLTQQKTDGSGEVTQALTSSGYNIIIRVRYTEGGTKYDYAETVQYFGASGLTITIPLSELDGI